MNKIHLPWHFPIFPWDWQQSPIRHQIETLDATSFHMLVLPWKRKVFSIMTKRRLILFCFFSVSLCLSLSLSFCLSLSLSFCLSLSLSLCLASLSLSLSDSLCVSLFVSVSRFLFLSHPQPPLPVSCICVLESGWLRECIRGCVPACVFTNWIGSISKHACVPCLNQVLSGVFLVLSLW